MQQQTFIYSLYEIGAVQFGEFQLKNGEISPIYINLRKIISYPKLLIAVEKLIWEVIVDKQFDLICGVPYTALPIATCLSLTRSIPMIMKRKEKKHYGTKQLLEGEFREGQTCLLIEDIITSGSSLNETAHDLIAAGLIVKNMVAIIDREQGGKEHLSASYEVTTLFRLSDLLKILLSSTYLSLNEKQIVEKFLTRNLV